MIVDINHVSQANLSLNVFQLIQQQTKLSLEDEKKGQPAQQEKASIVQAHTNLDHEKQMNDDNAQVINDADHHNNKSDDVQSKVSHIVTK